MRRIRRAGALLLALLTALMLLPGPAALAASGTAAELASVAGGEVGTASGNKYRTWFYGSNRSCAWCAIFVSWCANQAGVSTAVIPKSAAVGTMRSGVLNGGGQTVSSPAAGDLVFYFDNGSRTYAHVGIMTGAQTSVQGNLGGAVKHLTNPNQYILRDGSKNYRVEYVRPAYGNTSGAGTGSTTRPQPTVTVSTEEAGSVTDTAATLYGAASATGVRITEVGMYLGSSSSNMTKLGSDPVNSYGPSMWYNTEKYGRALEPGTTYYYRAYAVAGGKTYYGPTKTFSTTGAAAAASIALDRSSVTIQNDVCISLSAVTAPGGQTVSWSSSNPSVATVDGRGEVTGLRAGETTVTASMTYQGKTYSDTCLVTVTEPAGISLSEASLSLKDGESVQLTADTTPADLTVYWSSSDTSVAVVSSAGKVFGRNAGSAVITARVNHGTDTYTASCTVTVTPSVEQASVSVSPASLTLADNAYEILSVDTVPNNRTVSWSSSDPSVATVSGGRVEAVAPGTAVITVSMSYNGAVYSDSCTVTVEHMEEELTAPVLTVSDTQIAEGENFTASWTAAASDAVYYINASGSGLSGEAYMFMGKDTDALSSAVGGDWAPGTYRLHVVARNDSGQIKSNEVTVEVTQAGGEAPDPARSELTIAGLKLPSGSLRDGDRISVSGTIRSNYALSEIRVTVTDNNSGQVIYSQAYSGDGALFFNAGTVLVPAVRAANYLSTFTLSVQVSDLSGKQITEQSTFTNVG